MRRGMALAAVVAALALGTAVLAEEIVTYRITRATAPPRLDGVLDDACWPRALVIDDFGVLGRGDSAAPVPATQAWLTYDADDLYVAFRCAEPLARNSW